MIVTPVSRNLGTGDKASAAAFYRDVLGFTIDGDLFVNGPAQLDFGEQPSPSSG